MTPFEDTIGKPAVPLTSIQLPSAGSQNSSWTEAGPRPDRGRTYTIRWAITDAFQP